MSSAMSADEQREVIEFLADPATHGGGPVERIDTHASVVFLAGTRAWKLKRAVRYDYLDYSTLDRRQAMCLAEFDINRRTAPSIYLGVVAVTRTPAGALALGGHGVPVEWLVEMRRFDQRQLLDRLAAQDALPLALMPSLAAAIAALHARGEVHVDRGGPPAMHRVIDGNERGFAEQGAGMLPPAECAALTGSLRAAVTRHAALLDGRRAEGRVRRCHGDLHLRNVVLIDGAPVLFDAIEFNDEIAIIDVLYDLAFLLMDLWHRELPGHANALWQAYLSRTGDIGGLPLLPLFLSCRAAVRAKTTATAARLTPSRAGLQTRDDRRARLQTRDDRRAGLQTRRDEDTARDYLRLASSLLRPPTPCIVAIGGRSGCGKSTLARALAPRLGAPPGAVIVRNDEIRKRLFGVEPHRRLGDEGYRPAVSERVYTELVRQANAIATLGGVAIADAVFLDRAHRDAIETAARSIGAPFVGIWLDAPLPVLVDRVTSRGADVSDADAAVVRSQAERETGEITWAVIDASAGPDAVVPWAVTEVHRRVPAVMSS